MPRRVTFPSDDMIVLAALLEGEGNRRAAEDIASVLRRLGFDIAPQRMVGQLQRLLREEVPMFESAIDGALRLTYYRVTAAGRTQLANRFPCTRRLWA